MTIEVRVTGRSCHGSIPREGLNPLEHGGAILAEAAARHERGEGFLSDPLLGPGSRTASWAELETPSDCSVPERFAFRLDRRLTTGESPERALRDVESLESRAPRARRGPRGRGHGAGLRAAHLARLRAGQPPDLPVVADARGAPGHPGGAGDLPRAS